jgi:MFS family permease
MIQSRVKLQTSFAFYLPTMATEPTQSVFRNSYGADKDVLKLQAIHQSGTETITGKKGSNGRSTITTEAPTLSTEIHKPTNLQQAAGAALNPCSLPQPGGAVVFHPITLTHVRRHSRGITTADAPLSDARLESTSSGYVDSTSSHPQPAVDAPEEHDAPRLSVSQSVPSEIGSLLAEIVFVITCTAGQVVSSLVVGHITVTQIIFREALGIPPTQAPWLIGSSALASGLSVIISGSLADLNPPKPLMIGGFLWGSMWNAVTAVVITPKLAIMFFVARAMNGFAVGVLVTSSMSILGRVYKPGIRKTRVFSFMAAGSPLGFWIGCMQGGALCAHLPWIFGSTSIFLAACAFAAHLTVPALRPANDSLIAEAPSSRQFDYAGAFSSSMGCALILFGLTQGPFAHWHPYTYCLIILGLLMLVGFYHVERRVDRPIVPNELWQIRGFVPLLVSYFLGQGAYSRFLILLDLTLQLALI